MEDPIVSDVIIENRAGVGSVFHDDSMFGAGKKNDPLGVNREMFVGKFSVLPEPSESLLGKIYFYDGDTVDGFVNGYFYQCIESQLIVDYSDGAEYVADVAKLIEVGYSLMGGSPEVGDDVLVQTGTHAGGWIRIEVRRNGEIALNLYQNIEYPNINDEFGLNVRQYRYDTVGFKIMQLPVGYIWNVKEVVPSFVAGDGIRISYDKVISIEWNVVKNNARKDFIDTSVAIGANSQARDNYAVAVGEGASAGYGGVAIGRYAQTYDGIQLGRGGNTSQSGFWVGFFTGNNYKMLDSTTGKIPAERLEQVVFIANTLPANPEWKQIIVWGGDDSYKIGCVYQYEVDDWTFVLTSQQGSGTLNSIDMSKFITGDWFGGAGKYYIYTYNNVQWSVYRVGGPTIKLTPEQLDDYGIDLVYDNSGGNFNRFIFNVEQGNGYWVEIGAGAEIGNINAVLDAINGEVV